MTIHPSPRIAIQNIHKLPNLTNWKLHNYAVELLTQGYVKYLYFDEQHSFNNIRAKFSLLNQIRKQYGVSLRLLRNITFLFTEKALSKNCDILLNFNSIQPEEFTPSIKRFKGIKIFHLMDYFWKEHGTKKSARLKEYGIDYVMSYSSSDKHCGYFKKVFPEYIGRVLPIPFGFSERFASRTSFSTRANKCVALGSVNPLRPTDVDPINYEESANFYSQEQWFHKFRRMIVENMQSLSTEVDSMLPVFPQYKDSNYDIVQKLNGYKMFICDESIFYFPAAKTFEGTACGSVLVCSEHPCFAEYGFKGGENCITHKQFDVANLKQRLQYYQNNPAKLAEIQKNGTAFTIKHYSHRSIARGISDALTFIYYEHTKRNKPVDLRTQKFWPATTKRD